MSKRTQLGGPVTLEDAYARQCRVEITYTASFGSPTERGYVSKNSPNARVRIWILRKRSDSLGGFQLDPNSIESIREVLR